MRYVAGFIGVLLALAIICAHKYIFPFVDDGEYWIERYEYGGTIHRRDCPAYGAWDRWFTEKRLLFDIMIEKDIDLCDICFMWEDRGKAYSLHYYNKKALIGRVPDSLKVKYMIKYK